MRKVNYIMKWIDRIPVTLLAIAAVFMALAPFSPEPHLLEKSRMLIQGLLIKPVDIFDLFWHGIWSVLLIVRLVRLKRKQ